jgi:hypothetical protein
MYDILIGSIDVGLCSSIFLLTLSRFRPIFFGEAVEAIPDLRDLALETVGHRVVQPWGPWKKGDPHGVSLLEMGNDDLMIGVIQSYMVLYYPNPS